VTAILETSRLVLRRVEKRDAAFMLELMNEPAYIANIGDRGIRTVGDAEAYIDAKYTANYERLGYGLYLVELRDDRVPVGICGFVRREALECADLGFAFLEKFRRMGFGFESSEAVLAYGRETLGFARVLGVTSPANQGSIQLLQKLGFAFDRSVRLPGYAGESRLYSLALGAS
jgi:ribosomal-protein-alanine N-acetyltransferase